MQIHAVPQRQGAVVERARLLPEGCLALAALAGEVLGQRPVHVPVVAGTSGLVDGIANRAELIENRAGQLAALEAPEGPVLTIGGDCGVDVAPIGVARFRYGPELGVVWFDAHPDLNTPETSPSGAFHGMALRALFGEGDPEFAARPALTPGNVALVGARAIDPGEQAAIDSGLIAWQRIPGECVYVHVDLDVLDEGEFDGACFPEPYGVDVEEVVATIKAISVPVVGAAITECATTDPVRLRVLVPIIEALGEALEQG